nr:MULTISPECIES: NUDIX domain-containing protein [Microbacterium]
MIDTAGDARAVDIPVAATVLILRDSEAGPEVLMIERPDRGSFAGAWVFPGGKTEPGDTGDTEEDVARTAGVRETQEETGLVLLGEAMQTLSRWNPPPTVTLRIRTWFFVARDPGGALTLAADEAVASDWVRPAEALERHGRGDVTLYPPTWVTLHDLAAHGDVDDIFAVARLSGVQQFETLARQGPDGPLLLWPDDAEYDVDAADPASGSRHRLDISGLPWVYTRD